MKTCTKCKTEKPITEFAFHKKRNHSHSWCKICQSKHNKKTYQEQPKRRQRLKEQTMKYQFLAQEYVVNHLLKHPCICGETNILTLQFDHLRDKEFEIGLAVMRGYSLTKIKSEIEKCQVLCANCHSIKTANQLNSWRLKWLATSDSNRDSIV